LVAQSIGFIGESVYSESKQAGNHVRGIKTPYHLEKVVQFGDHIIE
jgi:hypothetical protein